MSSQRDLDVALLHASLEGRLDEIESLLDRHANVNAVAYGKVTPLYWASINGHHQCVELLLDRHANVNALGNNKDTPLHWASRNGHHQCLELLIDHGASKSITDVRNPPSLSPIFCLSFV